MENYICYLRENKKDIHLIQMLSNIFQCEEELIGNLLNTYNFKIKFENRLLDNVSEFCTELNVYVDNNTNSIVFFNNFLFGFEVSKYLNEDILVSNQGDDPYQWILVSNNQFYIVEEIDNENYGIDLQESRVKISYNEAMDISS
ncbi:hypothetical protein QX233_07345 [Chryseobacterium gambrini]|uniref:Uncharacterized protein n=1 Tax=Chryseobacterium gambrini TaxID=373672 RepID=A0AAJ1R1Q8_9FLAO|nr:MULTISPECIES: hypothetical protein [Chryseobacterium]MDN4012266.1 hypothetical protein [Chryseobacterium gambrini]MDN4030563.1 hypothetical protein [Chryseobacterium gambrini]QWA36863.1 hypothetical protein KKI44_13025 [Chryseobacterium sp. ZHDP1]